MNPAEAYILKQQDPYKSILLQLQSIVEAVLPQADLLYKWRIPFYYNNGLPICFFNQSKDYVDVGFWHYESMEKYHDHFIATGRKHVRSLRYKTVTAINDAVLVYVIQQQVEINVNPFTLVSRPKKC